MGGFRNVDKSTKSISDYFSVAAVPASAALDRGRGEQERPQKTTTMTTAKRVKKKRPLDAFLTDTCTSTAATTTFTKRDTTNTDRVEPPPSVMTFASVTSSSSSTAAAAGKVEYFCLTCRELVDEPEQVHRDYHLAKNLSMPTGRPVPLARGKKKNQNTGGGILGYFTKSSPPGKQQQ